MKGIIFGIVLLATASAASGDEASKADKIRRLAEAQHLAVGFDTFLAESMVSARRTMTEMIGQMHSRLDMPPAYQARLDEAARKFLGNIKPPWTSAQMVDRYVQAYSGSVSEEEVDAALAYFTSDAGIHNLNASAIAGQELGRMFSQQTHARVEASTKSLVDDLRSIAAECKCARKPK